MTDEEMIALYWERSETALAESRRRYGRLCEHVAANILGSREDAEECLNDALFAAWNSIPPERPDSLSAYLAGITRNQALTRLKARRRQKRGGGRRRYCSRSWRIAFPSAASRTSLSFIRYR